MKDAPFPPGASLVFYGRDSGGAEQELSVPQQEQAVRAWCAEHGYLFVRAFTDLARSGKSTVGRDAFLETIDYLSGDAPESGVVIWEFARFSRDLDDLQFYVADLRRKGYTVHSLHDNVPPGLDGRLLESLIAWRNAKFLEDLSRNVKRGLAYVRDNHHAYQPHLPPKGYRKVARSIGSRRDGSAHTLSILVPDPDVAPLVQLAFQMKAAGHSRNEIHAATHLFTAPSSYARMYRNPIYLGEYAGIPDYCPALIDRETWDAVQDRVGEFVHPRRETSSYLLSGLARCAACGRILSGFSVTSRGQRYPYYRCISAYRFGECNARMIPAKRLEHQVVERLKTYLADEAIAAAVIAEVEQMSSLLTTDAQAAIERQERELGAVKASIARLVAAVRAAGHSPALISDLTVQESRQADLESTIANERRQMASKIDRLPGRAEIQAAYQSARRDLESAAPRRLQLLLRSFVAGVRAEKDPGRRGVIRGEIEFITASGGHIIWSLNA